MAATLEKHEIDEVTHFTPRDERADLVRDDLLDRIDADPSDLGLLRSDLLHAISHEIDDDGFFTTLHDPSTEVRRRPDVFDRSPERSGRSCETSLAVIKHVLGREQIEILRRTVLEVESSQRCAACEEERRIVLE